MSSMSGFFKTTILLAVAVVISSDSYAQNSKFDEFVKKKREQYTNYSEQKMREFEEARRKRNEEFAKLLREEWIPTAPAPVIPVPQEDSIPPVIYKSKEEIPPLNIPNPLPYKDIITLPTIEPQPQPIDPIVKVPDPLPVPSPSPKPKEVEPAVDFTFFGTPGSVRFEKKHRIHLQKLNENHIADAWLTMSESHYTNIIVDCLVLREKYSLCDWAYLKMLEQMAEAVCGKGTNESVLLMAYVYCQSGYKMRLANDGKKLYMLFATKHYIYSWNRYNIDGEYFYVFNNKEANVSLCKQRYPNEQALSMMVTTAPKFAEAKTAESLHKSRKYPEMNVSVVANQNALDFYSSYPRSEINNNFMISWAMYANMPMPEYLQKQVYPTVRKAVDGCDQLLAVNKILNYIQTGFEYGYDTQIWGGDRAFFPEETLHYPYCDCEDRSILLTRLVRDILGLKCILIYYPGHLATAVEITEGNPTGDYIEYLGHRFFLADPTITGWGAPVGVTMQGMDNSKATVIILE